MACLRLGRFRQCLVKLTFFGLGAIMARYDDPPPQKAGGQGREKNRIRVTNVHYI